MTPRFDGSGPVAGWLLAAAAVAGGWAMYGWQGALMGLTVVVFWLLLQLSRALRVVRNAAQAPLGSVRSSVMLTARLKQGMTMAQVLAFTRSLGVRVETSAARGEEEAWRWQDAGGVGARLVFRAGRLVRWDLERPPEEA